MGPAQQFGQDDAGLRVAVVVRLQAGEDQVELFVFDGGGEGLGGVEGVEADEGIIFEVDGAVSALSQRLAQHLLGPGGTGGDGDDFSAMLLFLAERLF